MPLDFKTLRFVAKPLTLEEGVRVLERDQYRCHYCGLDGTASFENALMMSVDFIVPRARKGKKDPSNLVACCRPCNLFKGRRVFGSLEGQDLRTGTPRGTPQNMGSKWTSPTGRTGATP